MVPMIGITCGTRPRGIKNGYDLSLQEDAILRDYSTAIALSGGAPVLIPALQNRAALAAVVDHVDALLLSGGGDIAPARFDQESAKNLGNVDLARDAMEFLVLERALERNIPILGICRGIQTLNVGLGGTLYQDLASQSASNLKHADNPYRSPTVHKVKIDPDNLLSEIIGEKEIWVNSLHHQAVKGPGRGLKAIAKSSDGIIEGVVSDSGVFILGVQWHPEGTYASDSYSRKIFNCFAK